MRVTPLSHQGESHLGASAGLGICLPIVDATGSSFENFQVFSQKFGQHTIDPQTEPRAQSTCCNFPKPEEIPELAQRHLAKFIRMTYLPKCMGQWEET